MKVVSFLDTELFMDNNICMKQNDNVITKSFVQSAIDSATEKLRDELVEQIKQSKDETLTRLDKILGLFQKFDEERTVMAYRQREHTDQLEDHEDRIKFIETKFLQ